MKDFFIKKATLIHGDKYDYSKVEYKNMSTKVCIVCPEHGEFWQTPKAHISLGYGCVKCGRLIYANKRKLSLENFIKKGNEIHSNKYDYCKVNYTNSYNKVCIICPKHGEFLQTPHDHLKGSGCPMCAKIKIGDKRKISTEDFIKKSKIIHGDKYDYSKVEYIDNKSKVCIICPKHGEFWQVPNYHLQGCGCTKCGNEKISNLKKHNMENVVKNFNKIHDNKYDYSKVYYIGNSEKVCIICPKHGEFWQTPHDHLEGHGCPKCGIKLSVAENEIYEFCKKLYPSSEQSNRTIIYPYELDIYIPEINAAIEYNGLLWHSDKYKTNKNYHLNKLNACKEKGIKLLQIFEDEYVNNRDIVYEKIKHILKKCDNLPKIMGRKCEVKVINKTLAKEFLTKYHIQGYVASTIYLGCYHNNELMGVMTFKQEENKRHWELTRFASNYNYICQGIGGKLFNYFIRNYDCNEIKSFADRRWTIDEDNNIYLQLGFKFDSYTPSEYRYFKASDGIIRQHKFAFRKQKLNKKYGLPLTMTEREMTDKLGYTRIYDCGLIKYVWKKEEKD